ncbi:MAG: heme exporter protein CcmD [Pseudomonadota bacterium]
MHEFFAMSGYATYVWGSFGLTFAVLIANWWFAVRKHQATLQRLRRQNTAPDAAPASVVREVVT